MQPSLRDLQKWMRWVLTDPRGVDAALTEPAPDLKPKNRYTRPGSDWSLFINESESFLRSERLSVYAEGYFARLLETLGDDFTATKKILGDESFMKLIADYLKFFPSRYFNAGEIGLKLPEFLQNYSMTKEYEFLSELALVEWTVIESFYADNRPKLDESVLGSVQNGQWPSARFELDPSVRLLETSWPVDQLWRERKTKTPVENLDRVARRLLIFRECSGQVSVDPVDPTQFQALKVMQERLSLMEICESIATEGEVPPLMEWFGAWIKRGIIRKINFGGNE